MASLGGKIVLVTGASSGIGEGIAKHFATLGSKLCLVGRSEDNLNRVASECVDTGKSGVEVITVVGDVCKKEDRSRIITKSIDRFGRLDVLVNNAGTICYSKVSGTSEEDYDDTFDTNVKSHVFLTQLAVPFLTKSKGNIVNISSICSTKATPNIGVYCMSKAALDMFTECLALDMAPHGVRVNAISPATVVSNIHRRPGKMCSDDETYEKFLEAQKTVHPLGRVAVPQDCAEAVAFLASDAASFISGQSIYIDGARHCLSPGVATNIMQKP